MYLVFILIIIFPDLVSLICFYTCISSCDVKALVNFATMTVNLVGVGDARVFRLSTDSSVTDKNKYSTQWKWYADYAYTPRKQWMAFDDDVCVMLEIIKYSHPD